MTVRVVSVHVDAFRGKARELAALMTVLATIDGVWVQQGIEPGVLDYVREDDSPAVPGPPPPPAPVWS